MNPIINGRRYPFADLAFSLDGRRLRLEPEEISYPRTPSLRGGPVLLRFQDNREITAALGAQFMQKEFRIDVSFEAEDGSLIWDRLDGCCIVEINPDGRHVRCHALRIELALT